MFTDAERAYLASQSLARLATVAPDGQPDVAVLALQVEGDELLFGKAPGRRTARERNLRHGNWRVAVVVDDLPAGARPGEGKARGIKLHGAARFEERDGRAVIVVTPDEIWSWGIERSTEAGNPSAMRRSRRGP